MADEFKVEGLRQLNKKLQQLGVKTGEKLLGQAGRQAMKPVLQAAKQKVPVDTGDLHDSLGISTRKSKRKSAVLVNVGVVRKKALKSQGGRKLTNVNQKAIASEYGTRKQKATPFLLPALRQNAERVLTIFSEELKKRIEKIAKQ